MTYTSHRVVVSLITCTHNRGFVYLVGFNMYKPLTMHWKGPAPYMSNLLLFLQRTASGTWHVRTRIRKVSYTLGLRGVRITCAYTLVLYFKRRGTRHTTMRKNHTHKRTVKMRDAHRILYVRYTPRIHGCTFPMYNWVRNGIKQQRGMYVGMLHRDIYCIYPHSE